MAPRLQCFRAVQHATQTAYCFKAAFSTTVRRLEDRPSASVSGLLDLDRARTPPEPATGIQISRSDPVQRQEKRREALRKLTPAERLMNLGPARRRGGQPELTDEVHESSWAKDLTAQMKRRWESGDIYAPHDLSPEELKKWKGKTKNNYDVFDLLSMNPIDEYKNFSIMSEYMSPMGRIRGSSQTGLRPVNQRKIAKAIRRSIGIGIMPSVHRHPEILMKNEKRIASYERTNMGSVAAEF